MNNRIRIIRCEKAEWKESPKNAIATGSCDIGEATTESGEKINITWGRNIEAKDVDWWLKNTTFNLAEMAFSKFYEVVLH